VSRQYRRRYHEDIFKSLAQQVNAAAAAKGCDCEHA
jgi:hypothetical protein